LEKSDSDLPISAHDHIESFPLGLVKFQTSGKMAITDFMPLLAANVGGLAREIPDGWIIEKFQRNEQGLKLINLE
jgi:hypothetical protein